MYYVSTRFYERTPLSRGFPVNFYRRSRLLTRSLTNNNGGLVATMMVFGAMMLNRRSNETSRHSIIFVIFCLLLVSRPVAASENKCPSKCYDLANGCEDPDCSKENCEFSCLGAGQCNRPRCLPFCKPWGPTCNWGDCKGCSFCSEDGLEEFKLFNQNCYN